MVEIILQNSLINIGSFALDYLQSDSQGGTYHHIMDRQYFNRYLSVNNGITKFVIIAGIITTAISIQFGYSQTLDLGEKGIPIHRQYMPSEYDGHTQNWAVAEGKNGLIYVGNGNGLLEYDGVEWKMIEVAGGQVALSLALGHDGNLYVGSVNDFGVIESDSLGRSVFRSIAGNVPDELADFEDVWETQAYSGGVLFRTRSAIFHQSYDDSLTIIRPVERFERLHKVGDEIYLVDFGEGLVKFENNQIQTVPGGSRFKDISIWFMGSRPEGSTFIATREGTFLLDGETIEPYETEISPALTNQNVYHATEVKGLGYAFATIRGGVYLTNYSGEILNVLGERVLTSVQSTYVYADRFNNLWVATTNGFNRVEISTPLTYFDESTGLSTGVVEILRHKGKIFTASGSEIQYLEENWSPGGISEFITIPSSAVSFNSLVSTEFGLFATSNESLLEVSEDSTSKILPELDTIVASQSAFDPAQILVGHIDGIAIFEFRDGELTFVKNIDGISEQVYTIEQGVDGVIWAGTEFQGLIRIETGDSEIINRFEPEEHFNSGTARVFLVNDKVVISTFTGIYRPSEPWNPEQPFTPDVSDLMEENQDITGTSDIAEGPDDGFWVVTDATLGYTPSLENPLDTLYEGALARISSATVKNIFPDEEAVLWVANEDGIVRYNSKNNYLEDISFDAFVRRVTREEKLLFGGSINAAVEKVRLPYEQNDLRFRFGTNFIEDEAQTWYQVRMAGFDDDWTSWTRESFKDYTNIPHGDYTLEVRARNTYEQISSIGTYSFSVLPPWWFSWWAYAAYFLLFIGGLSAVDRFQRKRLIRKERERAREKELEQAREIEKAYENLKAAKEQLVQQEKLASLGQLTAGIAHEIKNPLNFVNNFSELSVELVEEARDEVKRQKAKVKNEYPSPGGEGHGEGEQGSEINLLLDILDDIEANLKTIHKHGSRADSIVKSMLQHSRGGSGEMEPTDLNGIIKEYVNLSFHGMRAGTNPINVDVDLQLDENIGEVPLVAEDFSRVILNLVNNAFDAMREKQGAGLKVQVAGGFEPKLTVRTKSLANAITIEIEDNGLGIPEDMKDKILQPFFTTKKGTQGTGLGLSITNDIVKAHGGQLSIQSDSEGSTFIIMLPVEQ